MTKKLAALIVAASTVFSQAAPYAVMAEKTQVQEKTEETVETADKDETQGQMDSRKKTGKEIWEKRQDLNMNIHKESSLRKEAGLTQEDWDARTALMKEEGLALSLDKLDILREDSEAEILSKDGVIYYIGRNKALPAAGDVFEAYRTAYSLVKMLGGGEDTDLRLWSVIDIDDKKVYSFQQVSNNEEVMGSVIKIAADQSGEISAVFSSLDPEATKKENLITQSEAEMIVRLHMDEKGEDEQLFPEITERTIYWPVCLEEALNLDEETDPVPSQVVWVVYTSNTDSKGENYDKDRPYLAHYVMLDGTYIKSLPIKEPGSEEALNGYEKQDVFAGMTADSWTGEIVNYNGESRTVTVPVMKSEEDGKWYLGDITRRIAVADFAEAAYGDHKFEIVSCPSNTEWDNEDIYGYYNYIRAWDFYKEIGWNGSDGQGSDEIILRDMCTSNGAAFENACSIGKVENYSLFGYTRYNSNGAVLGLVQGLDIMAHEYTHTFTQTLMNNNLYENDYGAINEAMSDIMGNLIEHICNDSEDPNWLIGENAGMIVRSMSDPDFFEQPEYVWDSFYGPHTDTPTDMNDRGGVHVNSSLLNRIAALLCTEYDMNNDEAAVFWLMTAAALTPKTDYVMMPAALDWALEESGGKAFKADLDQLVKETRISETEIPEYLPADQRLVKLELPDTEAFEDENWVLISYQVNMDSIKSFGNLLIDLIKAMFEEDEGFTSIGKVLSDVVNNLHLDGTKLELDRLDSDDKVVDVITDIVIQMLQKVLVQGLSWEKEGSGEIVFVEDDNPSLYVLINMTESGTVMNGLAVLWNGTWYDLGDMMTTFEEKLSADGEKSDEAMMTEMLEFFSGLFTNITENTGDQSGKKGPVDYLLDVLDIVGGVWNFIDHYFLSERPDGNTLVPAEAHYLPTEGLDKIAVYDNIAPVLLEQAAAS